MVRAIACWAILAGGSSHAADVTIQDRAIFVNGAFFVMKGVCYQPTPVGQTATKPPFGDYFTSTYRSLYERDLPMLRAMGANTVRVYNWDPAANHSHFLDLAWNNGHQPIHVLVNAYIDPQTDWSSTSVFTQLKARWRTLVENTASHPATLGFLIGNELNVVNDANPVFWSRVNEIAIDIRALAPNRLVTTPLADKNLLSVVPTYDAPMAGFNCWAIQAYRGRSFGTLFTDYATVSGKPLLVTEFGIDAYDRRANAEYAGDAALPADYLKSLWLEIARRTNIVSGGVIFEWVDEWWKDQSANTSTFRQDNGAWTAAGFPDRSAEHEWWGICRAAAPGSLRLQPRAAYTVIQELWQAPRPRFIEIRSTAMGAFETLLDGPAGLRFKVQVSRDESAWVNLATNTIPFLFTEPAVSGHSRAIYRAVLDE